MPDLYCWAATDVGRLRSSNEDAFSVSALPDDCADSEWQGSLGASGWAVVADGMGGHAAGEVASMLAVECFRSILSPAMSISQLIAAIEETNRALFDAISMRPDLSGMGTTIAGALIDGRRATIFNVGDSRIYISAHGAIQQLSEDHVVDGNQLTKCLGGTSRYARVNPFVLEIDVPAGSRLLLCTDGLTNEITDAEIEGLLNAESPATALVEAAVAARGRDNATAVVISL